MAIDFSATLPRFGNSLSHLREGASPAEVAKEFEALLLSQLLQVMRQSVGSSDASEAAPGKDIYMEMMDQELARALANRGGIGLADIIERALTKGERASGLGAAVVEAPSGAFRPARVTSGVGWRQDPFTGEWRFHKGVDLGAPEGTPVASLTRGKVVFSGWQRGYGNTVVIENDTGVRTRYAHLSERGVNAGEEVSKDQVLGKVGSTGRATGPHLHLEMEKDGRLVDPMG